MLHVFFTTIGVWILKNLAAGDNDIRMPMVKMEVADVLLATMRSYPTTTEILLQALAALKNLAIDDEAEVAIVEAGGVDAVVQVMRANTHSSAINEQVGCCPFSFRIDLSDSHHRAHVSPFLQACRTLINFSANPKHKALIASRGGVELVVAAMRAEPKSAVLAKQACWLLRNLAQNPELRQDLGSKGALDAILACVRQHMDNPAVLEQVGIVD